MGAVFTCSLVPQTNILLSRYMYNNNPETPNNKKICKKIQLLSSRHGL